jgi:hypothetical protein
MYLQCEPIRCRFIIENIELKLLVDNDLYAAKHIVLIGDIYIINEIPLSAHEML